MSDVEDVIEAFVDGESVEPQWLDAALASVEGRAWLVDLLVLRGLVGGQPVARPAVVAPIRSRAVTGLRLWTAAAAIAGLGVFGGYLIGARSAAHEASAPAVSVANASAPAPTHVIRLENGVDWTERGGGQ
jgi:hypothetical protein